MVGGRAGRGFEKTEWMAMMEVEVGCEVAVFCELEAAGE
jgi:hypothetical protein